MESSKSKKKTTAKKGKSKTASKTEGIQKKTTAKKTVTKKTTTARTSPQKPPVTKTATMPAEPTPKETPTPKKVESTDEKIKKVGDRLSEVADRGVDVLREVFGKVKDFSVDAAELTRLKVDIHRLKADRDRMYIVMGEKLWELKDSKKLGELKTLFEGDFHKLETLNAEIKEKEKLSSKISL